MIIIKNIPLLTFLFLILILLTPNLSGFSASAQIIIGPGTCPPGQTFIPPNICAPITSPSPSISPTPPPLLRDPIVLVPGITVSQNKKLLYKDDPTGKWKFAFKYNVYKGLIKKLETSGYTQGHDLLIAHYDWRNPANHNASTYLEPIIDQAKSNTGANKVDIVAHSFGGIVSRAYVQGDGYDNDVDKLITLGSPHKGSADSYVAWEGGIFPEGWNIFIKRRVGKIEATLKKTRSLQAMQRPLTFRSFFPSLKDMLPLNDFVYQDSNLLENNDLTEQNNFLQNLQNTFSEIATQGVSLSTFAGTNTSTIGSVNLDAERSSTEIKLEQWRDGSANPPQPPLNSSDGDARVLLSSAHVGTHNITVSDAVHHKLPDATQNKVFEVLELQPESIFNTTFPSSMFGVVILSPLDLTLTGPNGKILSLNQNDFGPDNAEYDDDPNDPDDPKEINIADPPPGDYTLSYTGTGDGEYTIITSYADEDETKATTFEGATSQGEIFTQKITISDSSIDIIDDTDYKSLLKEMSSLIKQAKKDKLIKGYEKTSITRPVTHALTELKQYEKRLKQNRESSANKSLKSYYKELDQLQKAIDRLSNKPKLKDLPLTLQNHLNNIHFNSP